MPVFSVIAAKLFSSAGTGFTYTFRRPRTSPKFELRKFDPIGNQKKKKKREKNETDKYFLPLVNRHVLFTENKPAKPQ